MTDQYNQPEINRVPLSYLPGVAVEQFGAVGDGITDDAEAINLAADRALEEGHGVVLFSGKDYLIGSKIIHKRGIVWRGEGRVRTRIIGDNLDGPLWGAPDPDYSVLSEDRVLGGSIDGIQFDNISNSNVGGVGIDLSQISYVFLNDVAVNRCETGIRINNISYGNKITQFGVSGCIDGIQIQNGAREVSVTHGRINSVTNGIIVSQGVDSGVNGVRFDDITIEVYANIAVDFDCIVDNAVDSVYMTRMRYEGGTTAITVDGPVGRIDDVSPHVTGTAYSSGANVGRLNYQERTLGSKEGKKRTYTASVSTSDAAATLLSTVVSLGENDSYWIKGVVMGSNADKSIIYKRNIETVAYRQGAAAPAFGGTIQDATPSPSRVNGGTTTLVNVSASGNAIRFTVNGEAAVDMQWVGVIQAINLNEADD